MNTATQIHYTPRELEIIKLLLMGFNRKETGDALSITVETVHTHIKHLMAKMECHCIEDLIIYLFLNGFSVNADRTEVTCNGDVI